MPPRPIAPQRRHVSDAGCFASAGETEVLLSVNLRGDDGLNGRDGESYFQAPGGPGRNGYRGGDATEPTSGRNGGNLVCKLQYVSDDRRTGRLRLQTNHSPSDHKDVPIEDPGYVFVDAAGGKGGNGGRGGNGGPGSTGSRGRNATRFSNGTNGGPGGDGGDAGNPTDGKRGGDGGLVQLNVGETDTGLLMLVKGNLAAGEIGYAGESGLGGKGGNGGSGGSSYSWTTRHSYTDSQGRRKTRTRTHRNPGGSSGRDGHLGRPSRYRAKDAPVAFAGSLEIAVSDSSGQQTVYPSPFDLELLSFDIVGEYVVLEPDSVVSLDQITFRNCGGMPTPANYVVRICLPSDEWLLPDGVDLVLCQSLAPNQTHTFSAHGLRLRLGDHIVEAPRRRPFRLKHWVSPQASLESGINRPFRQFPNAQQIEAQFPVQIEAITCLNSLAPGESTRVIWSVKNISEQTFDQKYLYRALQTRVRLLSGDLQRQHVVFFDAEDEPHDLNASEFIHRVGELAPGESSVIETRVGIKNVSEVIAYQGLEIGVDLQLQRPASSSQSDQFRCVDYRGEFIRVSERYRRDEGSRFLLIANAKTDVNDIEKWTQLADYFGSGLDVWDLSYYGFLDLLRDVDEDESLLDQWSGMTIIIPNNYFRTPVGTTVAFGQLGKGQFLRAAADHDINFYIVGDSRTGGADALSTSLIPVDDAGISGKPTSRGELLKSIAKWNDYVARSQDVVGGVTGNSRDLADVSLGSVHEIPIDKRTILFQPDRKWLQKQARKLQRQLSKHDPLHRWVVVHRYDTGDTDTSTGLFRHRKVGKLEARRTLDSTKGAAVLYEVDAIDAVDEDFISSKENKHGVLLALKFEDKVDRFIRLVSERTFPRFSEDYIDRPLSPEEVQQIGTELVDTILTDLYNEQRTIRNCRTWGRSGVRALMPNLNYLAERSLNYGVTHQQMLENEAALGLLFQLIANIRYMALRSKTIWDYAIFPTAFLKRSRAVSGYMLERADRIVTNIFGREPGWWDKITSPGDDYDAFGNAIKRSPDGVERRLAEEHIQATVQQLWKSKFKVAQYAQSQEHPGLTYDPELLPEALRVMSGREYDAMVQREKQATQMRKQTEAAVQDQRVDLLVPLRSTIRKSQATVQTKVAKASR